MIAGLRLLEVALLISSPPDSAWLHRYGGDGEDWGFCAVESGKHEYVIVGHESSSGVDSRNVWMLAVDENGDSLWSEIIGGPKEDGVQFILNTKKNEFLLAGITRSYGSGDRDAMLIKTDESGNVDWMKFYGGSKQDVGNSVCEALDGGYAFCGRTESFSNSMDGWLVRVSETGEKLWEKSFGGENYDDLVNIVAIEDGYLLAGSSLSFGGGPYNGWLLRTNLNGDSLWSYSIGGAGDDRLREIHLLPDNKFLAVGHADHVGEGGLDCWLVCFSIDGDSLWSKTYGGPGRDRCWCLTEGENGSYILGGDTYSFGAGRSDAWLIKVNLNGDSLWSTTFGGDGDEECYSILMTPDQGYLITGRAGDISSEKTGYLLIKTTPDTLDLPPVQDAVVKEEAISRQKD